MGKYSVMTGPELAKEITSRFYNGNELKHPFVEVDFAILDGDGYSFTEEECEEIKWNVSGWYGIKTVDLGFDSDCLVVVADYYGGSCLRIREFHNRISRDEFLEQIDTLIGEVLNVQEVCTPETKLFIEFK